MGEAMNMDDFIKQDIPIWTRNTRKEIDAYTKTQRFQFGLGHTIIPRMCLISKIWVKLLRFNSHSP
jgi:hypothetical protein